MIFREKPSDFKKKLDIVSCFVERGDEILLLHRQDHKPQGCTWGVPAGKIDDEEDGRKALKREMREETGFEFSRNRFNHFENVFVRYPSYDFLYYIFHTGIDGSTRVEINPEEHKDYKWVKPREAMNMELIRDLDKCIKLFYDL